MNIRHTNLLLLAVLLLPVLEAPGKTPTPAGPSKESELKGAIATELVKLASWCLEKKLIAEGRTLVEEAMPLAQDLKAKALSEKLKGDSQGTEDALKTFARKRQETDKKVSGLYLDLFALKHPADQQATFDCYLLGAFAHDPKTAASPLDAAVGQAEKQDADRALRLLQGAERLHPDPVHAKALTLLELKASIKAPVLRKAGAHAMEYYLSLPKGWTPEKKWPVVVAVEGSGCNFLGYLNGFVAKRGDLPFILVTPLTFSNTNQVDQVKAAYHYPKEILEAMDVRQGRTLKRLTFDAEGVAAVLEDLRKECGAEEKYFLTGFSGGGVLAWDTLFQHPERLEAVAPACSNFAGYGSMSEAPEKATLPITVFQGELDPNGCMCGPALQLCAQNGFQALEAVKVPGLAHDSCAEQVMNFFAGVLKARK